MWYKAFLYALHSQRKSLRITSETDSTEELGPAALAAFAVASAILDVISMVGFVLVEYYYC